MKKFLSFTIALLAMFALVGCKGEVTTFYVVGEDTGSYAPAELSGYEVTKTVHLQIIGPDSVVLFSGDVEIVSSNPTVYEAFLGACASKGIAQSSSADSGWIQSVDSYINGTNDMYWIGYINGEGLLVGAGSSQVRNGDYVELRFEGFSY
jgi:hypothetical protein